MAQLSRTLIATALTLICLAAFPADAKKLVTNGSFEDPVVPDGGFQLISHGNAFSGWNVVGGGNIGIFSGDYQQEGFTFPAKKGGQWLDLTGNTNANAGVQQDIATKPGSTYVLTLYVGNINQPGGDLGTTSTVNVMIDGKPFASFTNKSGKSETSQAWKKFSTEFVAENATTTIAFFNGDAAGDSSNGLDGVTVARSHAP